MSTILLILQIQNLKENMVYQFQVAAANLAGVGTPSLPSQPFKCEEWTIAVPGRILSGRWRLLTAQGCSVTDYLSSQCLQFPGESTGAEVHTQA